MAKPIRILFSIENKELLTPLAHISHRYSQASVKNNLLRYFKSGVMLKEDGVGTIGICFSTKLGVSSPHVHKSARKTYIPFSVKINTIEFENNDYTEFVKKIGVDLIVVESCEVNIKTGLGILVGEVDPELSDSTFEIGYSLGQTDLVGV